MNLSKNFTLDELTRTDTGLDNTPNEAEVEKLTWLANNLLQPIRDELGVVKVNSAFRSHIVNMAVGGVENSQHRLAEAADIETKNVPLEEAFDWIRHNMNFGQLILEQKTRKDGTIARWIHISRVRDGKPNLQCMKFVDGTYTNV